MHTNSVCFVHKLFARAQHNNDNNFYTGRREKNPNIIIFLNEAIILYTLCYCVYGKIKDTKWICTAWVHVFYHQTKKSNQSTHYYYYYYLFFIFIVFIFRFMIHISLFFHTRRTNSRNKMYLLNLHITLGKNQKYGE